MLCDVKKTEKRKGDSGKMGYKFLNCERPQNKFLNCEGVTKSLVETRDLKEKKKGGVIRNLFS